jgi:predicted DNA-binding transcriptional regulator AlpA
MMTAALNLPNMPEAIARRQLLNTEQTAAFVGRSVPEIRRLVPLGLFPKPLKLNGRRLSWRLGDLVDWIDSKVEEQKATGS